MDSNYLTRSPAKPASRCQRGYVTILVADSQAYVYSTLPEHHGNERDGEWLHAPLPEILRAIMRQIVCIFAGEPSWICSSQHYLIWEHRINRLWRRTSISLVAFAVQQQRRIVL